MSYNYNTNQGQNQNMCFSQGAAQFQQNVQPLFPQPQGNVYNINSTLEVANVPVGAGISVALCLQEGVMYIKTMQNGNPLFWAYKIAPLDINKTQSTQEEVKQEENEIVSQLQQYEKRLSQIEQKISDIQNTSKGKGDWNL